MLVNTFFFIQRKIESARKTPPNNNPSRLGVFRLAKLFLLEMGTLNNGSLNRMRYLLNGNILNIQTDNGSEFQKHFDRGCEKLKLNYYYSRVRTPKDNGSNERFNQTLQKEFISFGNITDNVV